MFFAHKNPVFFTVWYYILRCKYSRELIPGDVPRNRFTGAAVIGFSAGFMNGHRANSDNLDFNTIVDFESIWDEFVAETLRNTDITKDASEGFLLGWNSGFDIGFEKSNGSVEGYFEKKSELFNKAYEVLNKLIEVEADLY